MKTAALLIANAALTLAVFAQNPAPASPAAAAAGDADRAKARQRELLAKRYRFAGGMIVQPGSQKGRIAILNAQTRVTNAELQGCVDRITGKMRIRCTVEDAPSVTLANAAQRKAAAKAEIAVFLVDDPALPVSLVAYEEHWGLVNVARLAEGADKVKLFGRVNAETMRIIALAAGGGDSMYPGSVMNPNGGVAALDGMSGELPFDVMNRMIQTFKAVGITSTKTATYRNACKQGWAPAPTNDVQKAIWDQVHEIPKNPMKIEFDPKKGR